MEGRDRHHGGAVAAPSSRPGGAAAAPPTAGRSGRRDFVVLVALVVGVTAAAEAWRHHVDARWGAPLARAAQPGDIRLLSSVTCVYCTRARQWLREAGVPFDECFIERDAACAAQYAALGGPGTPLVLVRGEAQLGFSPPRVAERLGAAR